MQYNRISADCHLDLIWLPPDLFVSEASRELKERMPYVADGPDGRRWVANKGGDLRPGRRGRGVGDEARPRQAAARRRDGRRRALRGRHYPDRHIGLACLPYGDIEAAVAEVHRVARLGFKGIELSCSWEMEPMWHPQWEPLWAAVNEVGIPLHFHTFPSVSPALREQYSGLT